MKISDNETKNQKLTFNTQKRNIQKEKRGHYGSSLIHAAKTETNNKEGKESRKTY